MDGDRAMAAAWATAIGTPSASAGPESETRMAWRHEHTVSRGFQIDIQISISEEELDLIVGERGRVIGFKLVILCKG